MIIIFPMKEGEYCHDSKNNFGQASILDKRRHLPGVQ